ncbi:MAG: SpoIIE family protein phosphatase [bacterium]|nr:SpoIIE family protein phosphatase [bacterium]
MKQRLDVQHSIFIGMCILMGAIIVIALVGAISWIGKPFAGFLTYEDAFVGTIKSQDWPGIKAGLKVQDRIVAVDGQPLARAQDVISAVRDKAPGTPVKYTVGLKDKTTEVTVPVTVFGGKDFVLTFLPLYLGGLAFYVLGAIVFLLKPKTTPSWVFLMLCLSLGTYMITAFEAQTTYYLANTHYFFVFVYPATFFHLGLIFPDKKRILNRLPVFGYLIYLPAVILGLGFNLYLFNFEKVLSASALTWLPNYIKFAAMARLFTLFCVASLIVFLIHSLFKALTVVSRQRARMILLGVTAAFLLPGAAMASVHFFKVNIPWNFLGFLALAFPASIAYSIVKHNLFDADTIIRRTVGYVIVTAIVIGAYAIVSISFNFFMGQYELAQSKAFPILFTLGVILIFNPLRDRVQALVDRIFFRKEYDYGAIIEKVGRAMTSLLDLGEILKHLSQTFMEDMFINTSSIILLTPAGTEYQVYHADGEKKQDVESLAFERDVPLMQVIEERKEELTRYDVMEDPQYQEVSKSCTADFDSLQASLMVPLVYQDQVIGSLNLGEKKSGKFYNREDIELLRTLANQGAIAIENARLFKENLEKQRMEEELNIARDLQVSMLPTECPTIEGLDIAAYSVSAREVGGDFYDFIDLGENKAGFVIGDVTGKSVSGALVMSASRSVFRMLSEETHSVSESMMRANRRLKKDIKSGMFVALLYAVVDAKEQNLTMCSAGQTQPIYLSSKAAEANLLDTEGDTFPLGILDDVNYEETRCQLTPGDKVIFYTDGIVEAMNEQEEIFGFERLLEMVKSSKADTAEELMNEIIASVHDFAGDASQHDDITVIVLGVGE